MEEKIDKEEKNIENKPEKKKARGVKLSTVVYNIICNIPVCFFLCLTSSICAATDTKSGVMTIDFNTIDWGIFAINYVVAFALAMIVGCFIPLVTIGRWFTGLFHVKNDTYTGNMQYRLLATLINSIIFYLAITPTLMVFNYLIWHSLTWEQSLINLAIDSPIMLLVGFTSSLINDVAAYRVAHAIDKDF